LFSSGGRALERFSDEGKLYWTRKLETPARFQILWVDGRLGRRSRSPKGSGFYQGAANVVQPVPEENMFNVTRPENRENQLSLILPPDARRDLDRLSEAEIRQAVLVAMHSWTSSTHQIAKYDPRPGGWT